MDIEVVIDVFNMEDRWEETISFDTRANPMYGQELMLDNNFFDDIMELAWEEVKMEYSSDVFDDLEIEVRVHKI